MKNNTFFLNIPIAALIILIIAAFLLTHNLGDHWIHSNDSNGPMHGVFAKNYLRIGYLGTMLGQRMNPRIWGDPPEAPDKLLYYVDHPVLVPLLVSFSYRTFGISEASTRIVAVVFSMLTLLFLYLIARRLFNHTTGILSIVFFMLLPIFLFFGRMTNHEVATNFFIIASLYQYSLWTELRKKKYLAFLIIFLVLGMQAGWPAYYLAALLWLHCLITMRENKNNRLLALLLPILSLFLFSIFLTHVFLLEKSAGLMSLADKFLLRSGGGFSWTDFFITIARYFDYGFTPAILVLAFFAIMKDKALRHSSTSTSLTARSFIIIMISLAAIHVVLFKQGALNHLYWIYYFTIPLSICSARAVYILSQVTLNNTKRTSVFVCVCFTILIAWLSYSRTNYFYTPNREHLYHFGNSLNIHSEAGQGIILPVPYQGIQLPYYADRDIRFQVASVEDLDHLLQNQQIEYRWYVIPKGEAIGEMKKYLDANYQSYNMDGNLFYDLHSRIF